MMKSNKFSELDIQDYAMGMFAGNNAEIEEYLKTNPEEARRVETYRNLFSILKEEPSPSLSYNLGDKVLDRIHQQELKEAWSLPLEHILLFIIAIIAVMISYKHFDLTVEFSYLESGIFIIAAILMVLVLTGFSLIEMKEVKKRLLV